MTGQQLKAPFPYFGGKSAVASEVWRRFGKPRRYIEPFFGSGAVLLGRPDYDEFNPPNEIVNDKDGFIANFWRAVKAQPEKVAEFVDWPVNENDLYARHCWLIGQRENITAKLEDPEWFDAKVAGWWVWGISQWIGAEWCSKKSRTRPNLTTENNLQRRRPDLFVSRGIQRRMPDIDHNRGICLKRKIPTLFRGEKGVCKRPVLAHERGCLRKRVDIEAMIRELAERLRFVKVCCGDWRRVVSSPSLIADAAIFLDPPYSTSDRDPSIYAEESQTVAHDAVTWAIAHEHLKIALCGYEGEHELPGWSCYAWKTHGGYASQGEQHKGNRFKERIWFSPACETCETLF